MTWTPAPGAGGAALAHGPGPIARAIGAAPALSSDGAGWRDLSLYAWRGAAEGADFEPYGEVLVVAHTGGARDVRLRVGRRWAADRSTPGLVTVVPPATPILWDIRGEIHSCSVHLRPERFVGLTDEPGSPVERLRLAFAVPDRFVGALVGGLLDELEAPKQRGPLWAETLGDALALHLLRNYSSERPPAPPRGGLSRTALRRACELVEASLEGGVSLDRLAREAGLSRSHFARAFRASTGRSPHQYLTERRIERARELLRRTSLPIVEVALACGFSSQSHFTEAFRRATGATPLAWRRG